MQKDLFEFPSELPSQVQEIISRYDAIDLEVGLQYTDLENMSKEMADYGYEFEFYLDCVPFNLRKNK